MPDQERRISALSPRKRALLERALSDAAARRRSAEPVGIPRRSAAAGPLPLSVAQRRLWFIHQLQPESSVYHITVELQLPGPVTEDVVAAALDRLVERHEVLRTVFPANGDEPCQQVQPGMRPPLTAADLTDRSERDRTVAADRLRAQALHRPFDLARGPLWRGLLLWTARGTTVHLVLHHIVFDGWSAGVLRAELAALIDSELTGEPDRLAELPIQYADFALWERDWLGAGTQEEHLGYWRRRLAGAPPAVRLPCDRPRPAAADFRGAKREFVLPGAAGAVRRVAQDAGATAFGVLFTAFAALLHRWSGERDMVIGAPVANRARPELQGLIGFFANTLPLRVQLAPGQRYLGLLRQVSAGTAEALVHQEVPLDLLVDELAAGRDLSRNPLFQVAFALEGEQELDGREHAAPRAQHQPGTSKFDLTLVLAEQGGDYRGYFEYSTALYDPVTIDRLVRRWERLLAAVLDDPRRGIDDLPVLTEEEQLLFSALARPGSPPAPARQVQQILTSSARRFPDRIAVEDPHRALSYRELDQRSNKLAHLLTSLGVRREQLVPVALERGVDAVLAAFGVLKAGAALLPLDAGYPQARLEQMLAQADAPLLITEASLAERFSPARDRLLLDSESTRARMADQPARPPAMVTHPDQLAYAIFTSGSTGRPKGVLVPHRGVVDMIRELAEAGGLNEGTRIIQFASPGFDASLLELLLALVAGGTAVLEPRWTMVPGADLTRLLRERRINAGFFSPSALSTLAPEELPDLRTVFTGGEAIGAEAARQWSAGRVLINAYGPTECTIVATAAPCTGKRSPVLGRPVGNRTVQVLDELSRPVPLGCAGELHLGGQGVARGYLNQSVTTAASFVPDASGALPGGRLYRTGDLVRWTSDGELEFLGRRDDQVKLRGFRVELGEVEAQLASHPAVRNAVVVVRDGDGGQQLVAHVVTVAGQPRPTPAELRSFMRERVPDYLVPAVCSLLDRLPMTANGKLDRAALPDPDPARPDPDTPALATSAQRQVADAWREVLGCGPLGPEDNFFEVGGNSLSATRVIAAVNTRFGSALPVRAVFLAPTVSALATAAADSASGNGR